MSQWQYNTQRWQRLRRMKLRENPLCEFCLNAGQLTVAVAVDHIVPISKVGDAYPAREYLMSCCARCHNTKTRVVEQLGREMPTTLIKGCDERGYPLDPRHPWYQGNKK